MSQHLFAEEIRTARSAQSIVADVVALAACLAAAVMVHLHQPPRAGNQLAAANAHKAVAALRLIHARQLKAPTSHS
jgi:uncharacterized membrane protein